MTTEELQNAIYKGIDQLAAENRIAHISTQLISRYSGISEGKMLRHIPSLDKVISKWLKVKEAEIYDFISSIPTTEEALLKKINALIDNGYMATLLISGSLDPLIETDTLRKLRKQFEKTILESISKLNGLPADRSTEDLYNELLFFVKEVVELDNPEARRKRKTLSNSLPWSAESDLFPEQEILTRLATSESGFVFDPVSGRSFTANEPAISILKILQQTTNISTIIDKITTEYEVTRENVERDILEFAGRLRGVL
ncbi:MAG: PqqD family protein [Gammaproteobacteria bacterium]|nr:MAG: PqqD family protein [Gammaproteobacteria bacterium]